MTEGNKKREGRIKEKEGKKIGKKRKSEGRR